MSNLDTNNDGLVRQSRRVAGGMRRLLVRQAGIILVSL
jgi:hypothetical protein